MSIFYNKVKVKDRFNIKVLQQLMNYLFWKNFGLSLCIHTYKSHFLCLHIILTHWSKFGWHNMEMEEVWKSSGWINNLFFWFWCKYIQVIWFVSIPVKPLEVSSGKSKVNSLCGKLSETHSAIFRFQNLDHRLYSWVHFLEWSFLTFTQMMYNQLTFRLHRKAHCPRWVFCSAVKNVTATSEYPIVSPVIQIFLITDKIFQWPIWY